MNGAARKTSFFRTDFVAGQIQAPMEAPAVPQKMRWDAEAKVFRAVSPNLAEMILMVGSGLLGPTTPMNINIPDLKMNQGVERGIDDTNPPLVGGTALYTWKKDVPRILNRNTLIYGNFEFNENVTRDMSRNLKVDLIAVTGSSPNQIEQTLATDVALIYGGSTFPYPVGMKKLGFKAVIPAGNTILNARLKVLLKDPTGVAKWLPTEGWSQTSDGVIWKDKPNPIKVIILPITVTYQQQAADGTTSPQVSSFTAAELNEFRTRYEVVLKKLYPFGDSGIVLNENSLNVQAIWDLGTRSMDGKTYTGAQNFTDPLTGTTTTMVPLVLRKVDNSGWYSVSENWDKLVMYGLSMSKVPYRPLAYAEPGLFLCVLIEPIAGVTTPSVTPDGTYGETFARNPATWDVSQLFAAFPVNAVDSAHELGHAHKLRHPGSVDWPSDPAYGQAAIGGSMIGGVGWDPFAVVGTTNDSGSPLSLLNSGSIASPVWGSLLFSPKNPVPYGLTKDLMDYLNRGNGENYWISDFHFQQIFTYNTTNNPAPTP